MYLLNSRWYNPELKRFMTRDNQQGEAADPISLNRYVYCGNDPVNYVDPMGTYGVTVSINGGGGSTPLGRQCNPPVAEPIPPVKKVKASPPKPKPADTAGTNITLSQDTTRSLSESPELKNGLPNLEDISARIKDLGPLYLAMGTAAAADGPFPIVDALVLVAIIGVTTYYVATPSATIPEINIDAKEILKDITMVAVTTSSIISQLYDMVSNHLSGPNQGIYSVYTLVTTTGDVKYVGRTKNYSARMRAHKVINPDLKPGQVQFCL